MKIRSSFSHFSELTVLPPNSTSSETKNFFWAQLQIFLVSKLHELLQLLLQADTLTPLEIRTLKRRVLEQISANEIKIYEFPETDSDEDEDVKEMDRELKESLPFAVIGSNQVKAQTEFTVNFCRE